MRIFNKIVRGLGQTKKKVWPDEVDPKKAVANLFVLQQGSYKVAQAVSKLNYDDDGNQQDIIKDATESIKKVADPLFMVPLGFPSDFVAAYPDVMLWWNELSDEDQEKITNNFDEHNITDKEGYIQKEYLRALIDAYLKTGAQLECAR